MIPGYKFKISPWAHQLKELEDHWEDHARAMLWQQRSGKSKVIVDLLGLWYRHRGLRRALIVAPNGVHLNWVLHEIPKHAAYPCHAVAWDPRKSNTRKFVDRLLTFSLMNALGVLTVGNESLLSEEFQDFLLKGFLIENKTALIVDESHHFGSPSAKRTRKIRSIAKKCARKRILSGTAMGNSPWRLYSQFEILAPAALGYNNYSSFKQEYSIFETQFGRGRHYQKCMGYKNLEELRGRVAQWSTLILRDDCPDLPPLIFSRHNYEPSEIQLKAYKDLKNQYIAELSNSDIVEALDAAPRLMRLQQILSNSVSGSIVDPENNPRLEALKEVVDGTTIVWCRYREDLKQVSEGLRATGLRVAEYHGGTHPVKRLEVLAAFQAGELDILVGQPACAGEGLDLSAAQTIVWYSHTFDVVVRDQANERATKVGGKSVAIVDMEAPGTIDSYILDNLNRKHNLIEFMTGKGLRDLLLTQI